MKLRRRSARRRIVTSERSHLPMLGDMRAYLRSCVLTCIRGQQCGKDGCATTPPVMRLIRAPLCRTVSPSAYGDRERFWDARYRDRRDTPMVNNNKLRNAEHLTSAVSLRSSRTAFRVSSAFQLLCLTFNFLEFPPMRRFFSSKNSIKHGVSLLSLIIL